MTEAEQVSGDVPTVAGIYDVFLGGRHATPAERTAAAKLQAGMPEVEAGAWANRSYHQRAARWIAEQGVRQFIDLGSGLPTQDNTHQVVQRIAPDAHVVYVDYDESTAARGRELVASNENIGFVQADMCDPAEVLADPEVRRLIDFDEPAAVLATAVLHFVSEQRDPWGIVRSYVDAMSPGSYLALNHATADRQRREAVQALYDTYRNASQMIHFRNREQVEWFFDGLELVSPYRGAEARVTFMGLWGCEDPVEADDDSARWTYCGVARLP